MPINVYLSVGRASSEAQERFVASVASYLAKEGLRARFTEREDCANGEPLRLVDDLMDRCAGTLVIALEKIYLETAFERRGINCSHAITGALTTPWNQIDAAFSYARKLPILVIKEDCVREEGMLARRCDCYLHSTDLDVRCLASREFRGTFESWKKDVRRRAGWFSCRH